MKDPAPMTDRPRRVRSAKAHLVGCSRLNVRSGKDPESAINGVITDKDRIKVNLSDSDPNWINVIEPIYGFCKREYIEVS